MMQHNPCTSKMVLIGIISFTGMVALFAIPALGCMCAGTPAVSEALADAKVVFVGTAVSRRSAKIDYGDGELWDADSFQFSVEKSWKGLSESEVDIRTDTSRTACGF
jgi:hypothetical protein